MKKLIHLLPILLLLPLLSCGCSFTSVSKKPDGSVSAVRASLGTNPSIGSLAIEDGDGGSLKLEKYSHEQSEAFLKALEALRALTP